MTKKAIIPPIDRALLRAELNNDRWVRSTRKGGNDIYIVNQHNAPNTMQEIGRLREITFRAAGGGTGEPVDIDAFDTIENCYEQLIVWDAEAEEVIGGYRFIHCAKALPNGEETPALSTAHYFNFTPKFVADYLPVTIELGRSWVQPNYQPTIDPRKGLYALDNIWDGLGALIVLHPDTDYFFGKMTMYPDFDIECRDFLLYFLHYYFPDDDRLMQPIIPLQQDFDAEHFAGLLDGLAFEDGFRVLKSFIRDRGENIPPLINIYMRLSATMKTFGTAVNPEFGHVEETGIIIAIEDIFQHKLDRYIKPMVNNNKLKDQVLALGTRFNFNF